MGLDLKGRRWGTRTPGNGCGGASVWQRERGEEALCGQAGMRVWLFSLLVSSGARAERPREAPSQSYRPQSHPHQAADDICKPRLSQGKMTDLAAESCFPEDRCHLSEAQVTLTCCHGHLVEQSLETKWCPNHLSGSQHLTCKHVPPGARVYDFPASCLSFLYAAIFERLWKPDTLLP